MLPEFRTRFAPSPTGPLHLGHAYSAILAYDLAMRAGGKFLLRIEDIDRSRAKPEWEQNLYDDLHWLGLCWEEPALRQSDRLAVYGQALDDFWARDLLYPCQCSRRDILDAIAAPQEGAAQIGPDGVIYPKTCWAPFGGGGSARSLRPLHQTLRMAIGRAVAAAAPDDERQRYCFTETGPLHRGLVSFTPEEIERQVGDFVIARKHFGTSYHLSVVLDDAAQGITHVLRGEDLFEATKIHVILQLLMKMETPIYHHHPLIRDCTGKRLAKRDDARSLRSYRSDGATPQDIRRMVGL